MMDYSDSLTAISSKLKNATESQAQYAKALKLTRDIALDTRTGLDETVTLYAKVAMGARQMGASQTQIATVTSNIAKAIAASGANAAEANSAVLQLGQALASGRLQGDELRAILESAPELANQIAKGLGRTVSEMRTLGAEGKLTSKDVFEALLKSTNEINQKAANIGVTFGGAFTNLKTATIVMYDGMLNYGKAAKGASENSKSLAERINDVAIGIAKMGSDFDQTVLNMRVKFWRFIDDAVLGIKSIPGHLKNSFDDVTNKAANSVGGVGDAIQAEFKGLNILGMNVKVDLKKIKIEEFIPKLEPMKQLVLEWCRTVEHAFWWVYDRVIGHSWIPDLVEGISYWINKLMDSPLSTALSFVNKLESAFFSLMERVTSVPWAAAMIGSLSKAWDAFENTKFMHNVRQVLGMKDVMGGLYADRTSPTGFREYDTKTNVGRGAHRSSENRPFLHDITSAFSSQNQIPFLATVASTIGVGLVTAFSSGSVIKGAAAMFATGIGVSLLGLQSSLAPTIAFIGLGIASVFSKSVPTQLIAAAVTTAFGLGVGQLVSDKEISITTGAIAKGFLDAVKSAIEMLFGSGIFGDRGFGGTLALIAKLALLFSAGRDMIMNAVKKTATSPIAFVDHLQNRAYSKKYASNIDALKNQLGDYAKDPKTLKNGIVDQGALIKNAMEKSKIASENMMQAMAEMRKGRVLGNANSAETFMKASNADRKTMMAHLDSQSRNAAKMFMTAEAQSKVSTDYIRNSSSVISKLQENLRQTNTMKEEVDKSIVASGDNVKRGVSNTAMGIGGIFGTLGGFNIGAKIAEQMVGYSDWAKVGVQMATAFVGQGLGAACIASSSILPNAAAQ
jgi:tape measure domain-containing protein